MENKLEYNQETKSLTICYSDVAVGFEFYDNLLEWLGDKNVVQANELRQNLIAHEGDLYELDDNAIDRLKNLGTIELSFIDKVESYKLENESFYNWYYNLK